MILPDIWGQGQLFAYSGMDGAVPYDAQMIGALLGDHAGVRLHTKAPCELYWHTEGCNDLRWTAVTSDLLRADLVAAGKRYDCYFAFYSAATIVGRCPADRLRLIFLSGEAYTATVTRTFGNETYQLTVLRDGDYDYFSLSTEGFSSLIPELCQQTAQARTDFYAALPDLPVRDAAVAKTFAKCVSVMKSQVYSPQGCFGQRWTTPNRLPHKALWLWDSVFHSFGNFILGEDLAKESLLSVLDTQREDGFIPHMATPDGRSEITQPPVLAWGVQQYVQRSGDLAFAADCFDRLCAYLHWNEQNRQSKNGLYFWFVERDSVHCRCGESGMDNCSRFDGVQEMDCIDFSCFMLRDGEAMADLAQRLNRPQDAAQWQAFCDTLRQNIMTRLWDERDGFFYDRRPDNGQFNRVRSVASFLPLLAGACNEEQKQSMLRYLDDPKEFCSPFPVAGIAMSEPTFGTDMWRGPVWINYNYMLVQGLERCGESARAEQLLTATVRELTKWYLADGTLYEFYDSLGARSPKLLERKGAVIEPYQFTMRYQSVRDYGWTCALYAAMVYQHSELF
ncbi:MAG: hypothetical protein IJC55_00840 [Clostridia bacterium]|nr:hypothetical protein [Clostridia bacterium]